MKRTRLTEEPKVLRPPGQPTKYQPDLFPRQAKFLAQRGATQQEMADCFGVSRNTLNVWINTYPEFHDAIQVDAEIFNRRVERALAERAMGFYADNYTYRRTTQEERDKYGMQEYELVPSERKYYPPETNAASLFLRNRESRAMG
jgi:hypothetical protein